MKEAKGPATIVELMERFPDEAACVEFLRKLRWPNGFVCPRCGARESVTIRTRLNGRTADGQTPTHQAEAVK